MPRPRSTGLNVARRRRADGSVVTYYYERATGRFLGHDRDAALDRIADVHQPGPTHGSLSAVILDYLRSPEYERLAPATSRLYRSYLDQMRATWGDLPVRSISTHEIRLLRDAQRATARKANQILMLFKLLLGRALADGLVTHNAAQPVEALPQPPRVEVWSREAEEAFFLAAETDAAGDALQLAILLLLYTVQRPSDVLSMRTDHVSERGGRLYVALRQHKTGTLLDLPLHSRLDVPMRRRLAQGDGWLVPSPTGKQWAMRNFQRAWDRVERDAVPDAEHRQRRDLRRTGIVRLAEAGATTPQIAAISGHGIDYCQRIIDTYLPRTTAVAVAGIHLWERHDEPGSTVVRLAENTRRKSV